MKIVKNKKEFNSFSIEGLSAGKMLAIHKALEDCHKAGILGSVGRDVLILLDKERQNFIGG